MNKIAVIIPVYNEEENICSLLEALISRVKFKHHEIILVDGGSTDNTISVITDFIDSHAQKITSDKKRCVDTLFKMETSRLNIQLFSSEKGRAVQQNFGAQKATGNILYFLHADTFPPHHFDAHILAEIEKGNKAGCFRMKFDSLHPVLLVSQFFTRFNVKWCRGGDQSLFITKDFFESLQGFDESYIIYEDCEFINRIYEKNAFTIIPESVTTSARKYKVKGTWKLQYHFAMIHIKKSKGATPEELYAYYQKYVAG